MLGGRGGAAVLQSTKHSTEDSVQVAQPLKLVLVSFHYFMISLGRLQLIPIAIFLTQLVMNLLENGLHFPYFLGQVFHSVNKIHCSSTA